MYDAAITSRLTSPLKAREDMPVWYLEHTKICKYQLFNEWLIIHINAQGHIGTIAFSTHRDGGMEMTYYYDIKTQK